jgi:4,5-dihydroxyphthalate decarboxylase
MRSVNLRRFSASADAGEKVWERMFALKLMLGTYPHTAALKSGSISSDSLRLEIADIALASTAFKRVIALEFDAAELSVITYLIAKANGVPLVLAPADLFKRAKPPALFYDASKGRLKPADLKGARIGVAYYTATTSIWMHCLLANAGVDPRNIFWIAVDGPLDPGFRDPQNVERAPPGIGLNDLLERGDVDAIVSTVPAARSGIVALSFASDYAAIPNLDLPAGFESHHMLVIKQDIVRRNPAAVLELWRMLLVARRVAAGSKATPLFGLEANRAHLITALAAAVTLGLVPKKLKLEGMFDDVTAALPDAL